MKITVEVVVGTEGVQKGCQAIVVRTPKGITQTPWLIGCGEGIATGVYKTLQAQYPEAEIEKVGF